MTTMTTVSTAAARENREKMQDRILQSSAGTFALFGMYLGDRLGYYKALATIGGMTAGQLAAAVGTHVRYTREWLEQQTMSGILQVDDASAPSDRRRYAIPEGAEEVLADEDSREFMAPLAQLTAGAVSPFEKVAEVFRTGRGIAFEEYGRNALEGQARMNRAMFLQLLPQEWLPGVEDIHARLMAAPAARVADIGCGAGWSSIGMALGYPRISVHGLDMDRASVEAAQANARNQGVEDRVRFEVRNAGDPALDGQYDLVTAFECVHDMSDPVAALGTMRRMTAPGGSVLVVDEKVADRFSPDAGVFETVLYGFSVFHCLPSGMCCDHAPGTGTVMRAETLRQYALAAGFRSVEVLPVDCVLFRMYRLHV